jgi:pyruvate/2-oxoglutarate dehydrogenase complex dihydrolipoamide acyltransferase (E2) component
MTQVSLAQLSATMEEASIEEWLVADGATVQVGQPIVEIMTDKVAVQLEATAAGVLKILVGAGETVPVGTVLGEIN